MFLLAQVKAADRAGRAAGRN